MQPLSDKAAERAVLAGICQYNQSYIDVADILSSECFVDDYNRAIYDCIKIIYNTQDKPKIDAASIYSACEEIGFSSYSKNSFIEHLESLFCFPIVEENVKQFAVKITKFKIAREFKSELDDVSKSTLEFSGSDSLSELFAGAEDRITHFVDKLVGFEDGPRCLGEGLIDYLKHKIDNKVDQVGIPTGLTKYDIAIGGGLRKGTINGFGARPGVGKTVLSSNIGYHIANTYKIPVLILDTEMSEEEHFDRTIAMASDCYIYDVETGKFSEKPGEKRKIGQTALRLEKEKIPYYFQSVSGKSFAEQIIILKRWLTKTVGFKEDGTANDCVVVYDWLQVSSAGEISKYMQENQILGFMIAQLRTVAQKYRFPVVLFTQLNRDGVSIEGLEVAGKSDRIGEYCSNYTLLKDKSTDEIGQDGPENGNKKLVVLKKRHGPGLALGDYINCFMNGSKCQIVEGLTKYELYNERTEQQHSRQSERDSDDS